MEDAKKHVIVEGLSLWKGGSKEEGGKRRFVWRGLGGGDERWCGGGDRGGAGG